jgi:DnaK suppressor protein
MDSHYISEFINERKDQLVDLRYQTVSELERIAQYDADTDTYNATQPDYDAGSPENEGDEGDESEDFQTRTAMASDLSKTLKEIDEALEKIEKGTYGRCEANGNWIDEDRLVAYPAAKTCADDETLS